jgi:hypothetical protein
MHLRFSRLSLLTKILLSTTVAITILFAITGQIVLHNITRTMSDSLQHEVQDSFRAYKSLWKARADLLRSVSRIMSDMSDVRAAFSTGDRATIQDSLGELWRKISDESAFFLVTDPEGRLIRRRKIVSPNRRTASSRSTATCITSPSLPFMCSRAGKTRLSSRYWLPVSRWMRWWPAA